MNMVNFGKMISKLRKKNKLTQKELAKQLEISDKAVSRWENGLSYPDIIQLPRISKIFGISIDYLLNGNPRGITIAGNIVTDILNTIDKAPRKNNVSNIVSVDKYVGGCVPNTAINLAKIDSELCISAIGKVGYDENGKFVVTQIKKNGFDVSGVRLSEDDTTSFSYVMSEIESGEQTTFLEDRANKTLDISNFGKIEYNITIKSKILSFNITSVGSPSESCSILRLYLSIISITNGTVHIKYELLLIFDKSSVHIE